MISKDKEILAAEEKLKRKKRAYSDLAKRLKDNEELSTREIKKLSEKQKIIQEQAKKIEEKEKEGKKILAATENLKESEQFQAEMAKTLDEAKAASSIAMKKLG